MTDVNKIYKKFEGWFMDCIRRGILAPSDEASARSGWQAALAAAAALTVAEAAEAAEAQTFAAFAKKNMTMDGYPAFTAEDAWNAALRTRPAQAPENDPSLAVIQFVLQQGAFDGFEFLQCWDAGDFEACRRYWPEAPKECYVGADPLLAAAPKEPTCKS